MLRSVLKLTCWLNSRSSGRKSNTWKNCLARLIRRTTSLVIKLAFWTTGLVRSNFSLLDETTLRVSGSCTDTRGKIDELLMYVHKNIAYCSSDRWIHPSHILMLGIGDCKNQASLLQAMFERCEITSELVIGLTNRRGSGSRIHAWVRVEVEDSIFICDPVVSGKPMGTPEYENIVRGFIDITPEYLLKEPGSAFFGVGKLSHRWFSKTA